MVAVLNNTFTTSILSTDPQIDELHAINSMLLTIGEAPLSSVNDIGNLVEGKIALDLLSYVNREIQSIGWQFNTKRNYTLYPTTNIYGSFIEIPTPTIRIDVSDPNVDFVERRASFSGKTDPTTNTELKYHNRILYDRMNCTFQITNPVVCDIVDLIPFDELPQAARHAITVRSSRLFQDRVLGSEVIYKITEKDEQQAFAILKKTELVNGDYNIFKNCSSMRILCR